ncbi:MAG: DUF6069 family protein [Actinomycetota bacterium]|nr:DUF6069 family protein [Actinomycetota bacterium]
MMPVTTDPKTRAKRRLTTVITAIVAACLVWAGGTAVLDHALSVPQTGDRPPLEVSLPMVVFVSALASLLGWGLLALLERRSPRGTKIWVWIAVAVVAISLLPLLAPGIAAGTRVVLALLHLIVAVVLIPGMNHTSPAAAARVENTAAHRDIETPVRPTR